MDFKRLSLAAIVATGALVSTSSAVSLEEAVKSITVDGMVRYRWQDDDLGEDTQRGASFNRYTVAVDANTAVTDEFGINIGVLVDGVTNNEPAGNDWPFPTINGDGAVGINLQTAYFTYAPTGSDTTLTFGKSILDTPITDSDFDGQTGSGVTIATTSVPNWTWGAYYFLNNSVGSDISDSGLSQGTLLDSIRNTFASYDVSYSDINTKAIYGIGGKADYGYVAGGIYVSTMTNVVDYSIWLDLHGDLSGFNYKAQYLFAGLNDRFKDNLLVGGITLTDRIGGGALPDFSDDQQMWGVKIGYDYQDVAMIDVGYTGTPSSGGFVTLGGADSSDIITAGKISKYITTNALGETNVFFGRVAGDYKGVGLEAGYVYSDYGFTRYEDATAPPVSDSSSGNEWYVQLGYDYNEDLTFALWYASYTDDISFYDDNRFRFEASYRF